MLSIISSVLLALLAIPVIIIVLFLLLPKPVFAVLDRLVSRALDIENYNRQSAYSNAGFLPVHTELKHAEIKVEGEIPTDFNGVYLRNGTNTQFANTNSRMHMFNGAGMLHQIQVKDGVATYSNSYVRTPRYEIEDRIGAEVYPQFGDLAGGGKAGFFA